MRPPPDASPPGDPNDPGPRPEDELRASEERFRLLAELGPQLVWLCDGAGRPTYVNPQWTHYTGLSLDETRDLQRVGEVVHPDDRARVGQAWTAAAAAGVLFEAEYRLRRVDGTYRWFLGRAVPVKDGAGRIVQWVGVTTDIDERKRAEEMLRQADRRKDQFLAMLAHELRNPLTPIRNALSIMRLGGPPTPVIRQARETIDRQVTYMARLIDDLLDVARIAQGKVLLRQERADLVPLVRAAVQDYRGVLESAGLQLVLDLPPEPLWVEGDPTRLAQAMGNLLHNAHKFTDAGGRVSVRLSAEAGSAVITVADTGIGLEAGLLPYLFEAFTQAPDGLTRSRGGLGLGLALVKGLVEMHGGTVSAASAGPKQGATFTIRLPLAPVADPPARTGEIARAAGTCRVLIIEDNRDAALSTKLMLELVGHRAEVAHTGAAGLEAARLFAPDVILCDLGLPGDLDGLGVAQVLRRHPDLAAVRLVALSGQASDEDRRRAREAGFDVYLTKPVTFEELQEALVAARRTSPDSE